MAAPFDPYTHLPQGRCSGGLSSRVTKYISSLCSKFTKYPRPRLATTHFGKNEW
jgi:hypothetical protein